MKLMQNLCFSGETLDALALYKRAFGCTEKSLLRYRDAVANGWEPADESKAAQVYHSEILFGDQEVRMNDLSSPQDVALTRQVNHIVGFDTAQEVEHAFAVLSEGGEVIRPLEHPPYMVVIGKVRDRFGVQWELMCDF